MEAGAMTKVRSDKIVGLIWSFIQGNNYTIVGMQHDNNLQHIGRCYNGGC